MKFFAIIAAFAGLAAATSFHDDVDESCPPAVTVTVTECAAHTPAAPTSHAVTGPAPYPTSFPHDELPIGTAYPSDPVEGGAQPTGTAYPYDPVEGGAQPTGTAAPSGTGAYSAPPTEFTGAASSIKVGGALAAGAVVAMFL